MLRKLFLLTMCCAVMAITAAPVHAAKIIKGVPLEGGEFDGFYAWDMVENWQDGAFPSIANGDDVIQDWTLNQCSILVDDYDPDFIKECVNYKSWTPQNTVLMIASSVEDGPGGVLTVSSIMDLAQAGKFNNKLIVKKGVLNAGIIKTGRTGKTTKTEVTIEVHEGGVINAGEIRLNEKSANVESFGVITMFGGELNVSGTLLTGGAPGSSALNLNGGTVNVGSLNAKEDLVIDVNGGTLVIGGDASADIDAMVVAGQVTVAGVTATRGGLIVDVDGEATTITGDPSVVDVDKAWDPAPLGAGTAYNTAKLTWKAGDSTAATQGHEVFLGMDPNVTSIGTVDAPEIALTETLSLGQTYYWRVDQTTAAGDVVEGNLWSFTVEEAIVVEDFEGYQITDNNFPYDDPNAVFNFWQDGLVDASLGGSFSGHDEPPFVETYDRWEGSQSLPMYYDNNDVVTSSVVKYTLPEAADWTQHGVKSLVLNFRGTSSNTVGDVYVMINDVKVSYALTSAHFNDMWHAWVVNLADVDATVLADVTSIAVGVDGANVSGILYIDNIKLVATEAEMLKAEAPADTALVAQYKLDGDFTDATGNGNDAVAATKFTWVEDSDRGTAWDANADLGAIVPSNFDPTAGTNTFTMSVWMKFMGDSTHPDDQSDIQHIFSKSSGWGGDTMMFQIEVKQDMGEGDYRNGRMVYATHNSIAAQREFHQIPVGEWSHNAVVFDGETITGYLNGIPSIMSFPSKLATKLDADVFIGNADPAGGNAWRGLNSLLSDMRIYAAPLTQAEVMSLAGRTDEIYKNVD